jgi:amino acid adenylation domain-containing protein
LKPNGAIEDAYRLSPLQEGMLFHGVYGPRDGMYVEQVRALLSEEVNVPAFRKAWQRLLDRHPVLRTAFAWEGLESPIQMVGRKVVVPFQEDDWSALSFAEQEDKLEAFLRQDRRRGFQLSRAPLLRVVLIRRARDRYQLVVTFSHLLLDGWSANLAFVEVLASYAGYKRGEETPLDTPRPYRDFITWVQKQDVGAAERFWRGELRGFSTPTRLGLELRDEPPMEAEGRYSEERLRLSREATAELEVLTRRHKITLNTLLQGVWALLLSRYSGQRDVVFGSTVSGRPAQLAGVESMLGLFINTLPVRIQVVPNQDVSTWLRAIQARQVEGRKYEHAPLVNVQQWSEVRRGVPLFGSLILFENVPGFSSPDAQADPDLDTEDLYLFRTNYPLTLWAYPASTLWLRLGYDERIYSAEAVRGILRHLQALIDWLLKNPAARLSAIPLLTEGERRQVLRDWNATGAAVGSGCAHEVFEAEVRRHPERVAAVFAGCEIEYAELNRRANQLARRLRSMGVGPDVLVGVCVERSLEMLVSVLAVMKAGGAYVPLDPSYPEERLGYMVEDSGLAVLLTQEPLVRGWMEGAGRIVRLDSEWPEISRESGADLGTVQGVGHLAYVIYTSGSTGRPKGVEVTQGGLVSFLSAVGKRPGLSEKDVLLALTTLSFDIAGLELYLPLVVGGRVEIVSREVASDGVRLAELLARSGATVVQATPATWNLLLGAGWTGRGLKVLCGGEALSKELAESLLGCGELWNMYGPTETTIWSTVERIESAEAILIGRPIANTEAYLLDTWMEPVPVGVAGELYLGGAGVARGYHGRAELTAERFVPDPFSGRFGARLYRTGDLARYRADGRIECLGRLDHQVKVRGFRIELGEIESALRAQAGVREAVVVAREEVPGDRRLVAYWVAEGANAVSVTDLRRALRGTLPEYMVPSAFVSLGSLPLTPNGKVDRKALPAPGDQRPELEKGFVAPRTDMEQRIAEIWGKTLGIEKVGIEDSFFDLGGHSLLLMKVYHELRQTVTLDFPLTDLFQYPTVEALAGHLLGLGRATGPRAEERAQDVRVGAQRLRERRARASGPAAVEERIAE